MAGCQPVWKGDSKLPIRLEVTKELKYRLKTYSVIGDLIVGVDHAVVC